MNAFLFLADDQAELMVCGGRHSSGGSTTTTTTTNFTFSLGQSNDATNVVLGGGRHSSGLIANGQSNFAVQGINILA
jgi:hypothetical protein